MPVFSNYGLTWFPAFVHQRARRERKSLTRLKSSEKVLANSCVAPWQTRGKQNYRTHVSTYILTYVRGQVFREDIDTSSAEPIRPALIQQSSKRHGHEVSQLFVSFVSLIFGRSVNRPETLEKIKVSFEFSIVLEALAKTS